MLIEKGKIKLKNIKIYAYHGCLEEEELIGAYYIVDVSVAIIFTDKSLIEDQLSGTLNYEEINKIVYDQMNIRSNLIENVAYRIIKEIKDNFNKQVGKVKVKITKLNPPLNGNVEKAQVSLQL